MVWVYLWKPWLQNSLLSFHGRCKDAESAQKLFDQMPKKDVISRSSLISGYVCTGGAVNALQLFRDMSTDNGIEIDGLVLVCVLQACTFAGYVNYGRSVHGHVIQRGFETDLFNINSLIDMYSKCLYVNSAYMVFIQMTRTNLVSWNCILSGLVENEKHTEALLLFASMKKDGVVGDPYTTVIKSGFSHNGEPCKAVAFFMQIRLGQDAPNSVTLLHLLEACSTQHS